MKNYIFLLTGLLFLVSHANSWANTEFRDVPKLLVRGEASIFQPADQMELSLGVVTEAPNASQAIKENNQRMRQVIVQLQALGLDEKEYQTGHFAVHPIYQNPPKDYQETEHKIHHYEVVNSVKIKTTKFDLAEKLMSEAIQAGANQIDQVNFNLVNPQAYREGAIQAAAQNAIADANALAKAMGVKIKRILSLALDHWQQFPGPLMLNKRVDAGSFDAIGPEVFEPGQAEIHATVNVTFEIGQ
jgi:uncharacterized protein YggE